MPRELGKKRTPYGLKNKKDHRMPGDSEVRKPEFFSPEDEIYDTQAEHDAVEACANCGTTQTE